VFLVVGFSWVLYRGMSTRLRKPRTVHAAFRWRLLLREANKSLIKFVIFVRTKIEIMGFKTIDIKNKKGFQAIRIPKQMQIDDDKVYLKKVGNALYIIPYHKPWQNLFESLDSFTSDFMDERDQPENQQRELFD
jgi:antitoxin VapB